MDFDLFDLENERTAALRHLDHASGSDVIVYDRGYHSSAIALAHMQRGLHFVFGIKAGANPTFDGFVASDLIDLTVTLDAPGDETALRDRTLRVRLVRYTAGDTEYDIATSLPDSGRRRIQPLSDLCHGRWGVEEMYRSGKQVIDWFHGRSVRGVRQELHAAFTLLTPTRQFPNLRDADPNGGGEDGLPAMCANFRNGLRLVGRETEALFLRRAGAVRESVARIMAGLLRCIQRGRPGRSYERESKRPRGKSIRHRAA